MLASGKWILRIALAAGLLAVLADTASAQLLRRNRGSNGGSNYYGGTYLPGQSYGLPGDYAANGPLAGSQTGYRYDTSYYYAPNNNAATIDVRVPLYAKVWFDGEPTQQTGELRSFYTPTLSVNKVYHYTIKVKWEDGGKTYEKTREIDIRPGASLVVDFLRPQPMNDTPELIKP
jgi:uncharacterized protein (TIGR03000 family)